MPKQFNKSKKKRFLSALESNDGHIQETCTQLGIPRSTFYLWRKEDEEFAQAVEDVFEKLVDDAETELRKRIRLGDTTAIIFFLKTKGKKRGYIEKQEMEHNVKDATTIIVRSEEERQKIADMGNLDV